MKYILWGVGKCASTVWDDIKDDVIHIVDGKETLWGKKWNDHLIETPDVLASVDESNTKIIIASVEWKTIKKKITSDYGIDGKIIDNTFCLKRQNMINTYEDLAITDEEREYLEYIKENPLEVFNHSFSNKYVDYSDINVGYDNEADLYYVYHENKRMYFNRRFRTKEACARYYKGLLMEQDIQSPHRYRIDNFDVEENSVVLDAGVAEGNFALEIIDFVKKIYLVECDELWLEALRYTFRDYKEKVEIVNGYLGDGKKGSITIDEITSDDKIDFVKMDIEGAEIEALKGADKVLREHMPKICCCTYHNPNDYKEIENILKSYKYKISSSDGYMTFLTLENYHEVEIPRLVRGLIRGEVI